MPDNDRSYSTLDLDRHFVDTTRVRATWMPDVSDNQAHDFSFDADWLPTPDDLFAVRRTRDTNAVYAVIDTCHGMRKVRVSQHLAGDEAHDIFLALELDPRTNGKDRRDHLGRFAAKRRRIINPGYTINGWPVRHFAVRSTTDPDWPRFCEPQPLRSTL